MAVATLSCINDNPGIPHKPVTHNPVTSKLLVGDIGGTHCRLATATVSRPLPASSSSLPSSSGTESGGEIARIHLSPIQRYQNAEHASLEQILDRYFQHAEPCDVACFAVAGPTDGHSVRFTNLAWQINAADLIRTTALRKVMLVNDFVAVGWGLNALQAEHLHVLQAGQLDRTANRIAVGAGTGLGVSVCVPRSWSQSCSHAGPLNAPHADAPTFNHRPFPTEGGHIGFAPTSAEQDRLLAFLRAIHGRVSVERILSGPGLVDLYRFCMHEQRGPSSEWLDVVEPTLSAKAISTAALSGSDPAAVRALQLFMQIYGQVAGDMALVSQAQGGVFLAGGIAPQLLPAFEWPEFLCGFHAKGRFSDWMRTLPIAVVLDNDIGLRGAAVAALTTV